MANSLRLALVCTVGLLSASAAVAESFVYQPINPAFGGNPDIYNYLQSTADIQNQFDDDEGSGGPVFDFPDVDIDLGDGEEVVDPDPTTGE